MDNLNKSIKVQKDTLDFLTKVKELMSDPEVEERLLDLYAEYWEEIGESPPEDFKIDISSHYVETSSIYLMDTTFRGDLSYEDIAGKVNKVGYGVTVGWNTYKEIEIEGVTFILNSTIEAKLPEEEIGLLKSLGKVDTSEGYVPEPVEYISCSIPF